jgi:hypothetical protein
MTTFTLISHSGNDNQFPKEGGTSGKFLTVSVTRKEGCEACPLLVNAYSVPLGRSSQEDAGERRVEVVL